MEREEIYDVVVLKTIYSRRCKEWRDGQAWFNAIHRVNPEVAKEIEGTSIDPYYSDENIDKCLEYLADPHKLEEENYSVFATTNSGETQQMTNWIKLAEAREALNSSFLDDHYKQILKKTHETNYVEGEKS